MAYLPTSGPDPDAVDAPFWAWCRRRQLHIQCCAGCGRFRHPPAPACARCRSMASTWVPSSGRASLFSFTVVHRAAVPSLTGSVPYNVCVAQLDDCGGVRLVSNVVDAAPEELEVGMALHLVWDPLDDGSVLPRFARAPR